MKIVYCINNTWYAGGMTRVLANKANYLTALGHDVVVITTDQGEHTPHYPLSERIRQIDLDINYLGLDQMSFFNRATKTLSYLYEHKKKLKDVLLSIKADIVISMFTKEMFILPGINDRSSKILETHTSHYNWNFARKKRGIIGKFQNWLDLEIIKKFDKFVVLTEQDKDYWGRIPTITSIPNANTFEPKESSPLLNKVVLAVGRCGYQKNFEDLLKAWCLVSKRHPTWSLKIVGDGVKNGNLRQLSIDLEIESAVCLQNATSDIMREYLNASIYVLSSRHEGLGMVLLEAQACGVPLVAYDCQCGPREIIVEGENGFLVDVGDVDTLANCIIRLIEDEPLRIKMGQAAKENSKRFSEKIIMQKWLDLFAQLQEGRSS